jgi:hypothetical protein
MNISGEKIIVISPLQIIWWNFDLGYNLLLYMLNSSTQSKQIFIEYERINIGGFIPGNS